MSPLPACGSNRPGHNVHPIQFFHGYLTPSRPVHLSAVVQYEAGTALMALVHVEDGPQESWLFHDLPTVRAALDRWRGGSAHLHDHSLLIVGDRTDQHRPCLYPCRDPEAWTECATIATVASTDPLTLTKALGGFLLRPTKPKTP